MKFFNKIFYTEFSNKSMFLYFSVFKLFFLHVPLLFSFSSSFMPVKHRTSVKMNAIIHFEKEVGQNKKC